MTLYDAENIPDTNALNGMLPCAIVSSANFPACAAAGATATTLANVGTSYPTQFAVSQPFLNLYKTLPVPAGATDNPLTGTLAFNLPGSQSQVENYIAAKIDHQLTQNNNVAFRYVFDSGTEVNPWANGGVQSSPGEYPLLGSFEHIPERNQYYTLQDRQIFSANLVNVASFSFVRTDQQESDDLSKAPSVLNFLAGRPMGSMAIGGLATITESSYLPLQWLQNSFTEQDEVDWVHGAHTFKFGGVLSRIQCNCIQLTIPGLEYFFNPFTSAAGPVFAAGPASGLEGFLEARPSTLQGPLPGLNRAFRYGRQTNLAGFIQDDWKVNRRLTLNIGLRDDFISNPTEINDLIYRITNPSGAFGNAGLGTTTPSPGYTQEPNMFLKNPSTRNIDPRFGLAWDLLGDHKTSLRAGFGIFHAIIYPRDYMPGMNFAYPLVSGNQAYTTPATASQFPNDANNGNFTKANPVVRSQTPWNFCCTPYMEEWSATIERQLPRAISISLGYVGSTGVHLSANQEANANLPTTILPNGLQVRCGGTAAYLKPGSVCTAASNPTAAPPNPNFAAIEEQVPESNSHYNGMVLNVQRSAGNVQFQSGFTWSRCIDWDSSYLSSVDVSNDKEMWLYPEMPKFYNKGRCGFDVNKNWTSNAVLSLPFHGSQLVEGWQISAIASVRTGSPISPSITGFDAANLGPANYQYAQQRVDLNPNFTGPLYERVVSAPKGYASGVQLFNPNAFQLPLPGYTGNAGRAILNGPDFFNGDLSLSKDTKIGKLGESTFVQLRADFFNVLNHTNLQLPNGNIFNNGTGTPFVPGSQSTAVLGNARQLQFSARLKF